MGALSAKPGREHDTTHNYQATYSFENCQAYRVVHEDWNQRIDTLNISNNQH
jgi:hypothetical protein